MFAGYVGSSNQVWGYTEGGYSWGDETPRFATLRRTGNWPALERLPPHQPQSSSLLVSPSQTFDRPPLGQLTPSTKISQFGCADRIALPARSAASRQSRAMSPQPQHAPVAAGLVPSACGSLCRSAPITVVFPAYRRASDCQSAIHVLSGTAGVYHSAVWPAVVGRWRSRITRMPLEPAYAITLS